MHIISALGMGWRITIINSGKKGHILHKKINPSERNERSTL